MAIKALDEFFKKYPSLKNQSAYAVAVSGGPDSMALAHVLTKFATDKKIHILTVDHGLREGSALEAQKVGIYFATHKNIIHQILNWQGTKPDTAVMEEARKARYDLMIEYCKTHHIQTLFIAHHIDDQAETFLIRLAKGSGLDGLSAMRDITNRGKIVMARPFLSVTKKEIIDYCQLNKITYISDPTNENDFFLRPRLRQSQKILEQEGLTPKRLAMTAKRLSRAKDALDFYVEQLSNTVLIEKNDETLLLDFVALRAAPLEVSYRVVQNLLESTRQGYDYQVRMEKFEDLFESLMSNPIHFKPRTLGGCLFLLQKKQTQLVIKKEIK